MAARRIARPRGSARRSECRSRERANGAGLTVHVQCRTPGVPRGRRTSSGTPALRPSGPAPMPARPVLARADTGRLAPRASVSNASLQTYRHNVRQQKARTHLSSRPHRNASPQTRGHPCARSWRTPDESHSSRASELRRPAPHAWPSKHQPVDVRHNVRPGSRASGTSAPPRPTPRGDRNTSPQTRGHDVRPQLAHPMKATVLARADTGGLAAPRCER